MRAARRGIHDSWETKGSKMERAIQSKEVGRDINVGIRNRKKRGGRKSGEE